MTLSFLVILSLILSLRKSKEFPDKLSNSAFAHPYCFFVEKGLGMTRMTAVSPSDRGLYSHL